MKKGRKRIISEAGVKRGYTFWCYPNEIVKLRIEFKKLKSQRYKFCKKEE